jgi:hypothetical protein
LPPFYFSGAFYLRPLQRNIENTTWANREMSTQDGRPGDGHEENCCGESQGQTDFRSPERQSNRLIAPKLASDSTIANIPEAISLRTAAASNGDRLSRPK